MIDSNGNKITGEEPPRDMNFLLAEARFLMKGFRMEKSERLAMNAAQNIILTYIITPYAATPFSPSNFKS